MRNSLSKVSLSPGREGDEGARGQRKRPSTPKTTGSVPADSFLTPIVPARMTPQRGVPMRAILRPAPGRYLK